MMSSSSTQGHGAKVKTPPPDVGDPSHTRVLERNPEAEISFRTQDTKTETCLQPEIRTYVPDPEREKHPRSVNAISTVSRRPCFHSHCRASRHGRTAPFTEGEESGSGRAPCQGGRRRAPSLVRVPMGKIF